MGRLNDLMNKWGTDKGDGNYDKHSYANAYEELIDLVFRKTGRPFTILEVGVWDPRNPGASVRAWREFFGPDVRIVGLDINEGCRVLTDECNAEIYIVDQGDEGALKKVMEQVGEVDFIVDDGSHILQHQITTLSALWPHLSRTGFYAIEDLHAPQSQPKRLIAEAASQMFGLINPMWLSEKLLVFRKD